MISIPKVQQSLDNLVVWHPRVLFEIDDAIKVGLRDPYIFHFILCHYSHLQCLGEYWYIFLSMPHTTLPSSLTDDDWRLVRTSVRRVIDDEESQDGLEHSRSVVKLSRLLAKLENFFGRVCY